MLESDWRTVRHFKPDELKDWEKMDPRAVWILDQMRDDSGKAIVIHCGFELSGHLDGSMHGKEPCSALDCHIVGMSLFDQYLFAERYPWTGIGLYPNWNNKGLHLDLRTFNEMASEFVSGTVDEAFKWINWKGARWIRDDRGAIPIYVALNLENLKLLEII